MKAALTLGSLGLFLSLFLGTQYLHLNMLDIVLLFVNSNIAAFVSLFLTLRAGQLQGPIRSWIAGTARAWVLMTAFYYLILLGLSPQLRQGETFLYLFFPLILSTGFGILAFGPVRDWQISQQQKKKDLQQKGLTPKSDFPCFPTDSAVL